ncbi:hypothetical protein FsymDg_2677 [Candidatus Protofrankia datiscae]|uniref:Uncharacterized protein n=1 Tax=Candidatus Protofrankia datiscae TaxID=2716812 RepID=F8B599_9ACTN|nr:hypothetical protein FsymDg_2677 [Candidatus Protofrankia datiscae]
MFAVGDTHDARTFPNRLVMGAGLIRDRIAKV